MHSAIYVRATAKCKINIEKCRNKSRNTKNLNKYEVRSTEPHAHTDWRKKEREKDMENAEINEATTVEAAAAQPHSQLLTLQMPSN